MKQLILFTAVFLFTKNCFSQTLKPVDASSEVKFVIKNFGVKTRGYFSGLKGSINFNPSDLTGSNFNVSVDTKTVDTDNNSRDEHLKNDDYFDAEKYPVITVAIPKIVKSTVANRYYAYAKVTIKDVTKPVEFGFSATSKDGGYLFEGEFDVNRRDFGVGGSSVSMADKLTVYLKVVAK